MNQASLAQINSTQRNGKKQCRICLQDMNESEVHKYCKCKGSLKSVHANCLIDWVRNQQKKSGKVSEYEICEICKDKIDLITEKSCSCVNCIELCSSLFCEDNYQDRNQAIGVISMMVLCVILIVCLVVSRIPQSQDRTLLQIIIGLAAFCFVILVYFIGRFMIVIKMEILGVRERAEERKYDNFKITSIE